MSDRSNPRLAIFFFPVVVVAALALGGCTQKPISPAPPGGVYLSKSAGASFDQSVDVDSQPGQYISSLNIGQISRASYDTNTLVASAGGQDIVMSNNDGDTWNIIKTPLTQTLSATILSNKILVVAGTDANGEGYVVRSEDNGQSWDSVFTIPLPKKQGGIQLLGNTGDQIPSIIITLARDPFDGQRVYAGTNVGTVFAGEQSAKVWRTITTIQPRILTALPNPADAGITKLIPSPFNKNEFLVVTHDLRLVRVTDTKVAEVTIPAPQTDPNSLIGFGQNRKIYDAQYIAAFPNALIVGSDQAVLSSKDQGKTWTDLQVPLDTTRTFTNTIVTVSPTNPNRIFAVVDTVIYRSEDGGQTWNTESLGLPSFIATQISINPTNPSRVLIVVSPSKS